MADRPIHPKGGEKHDPTGEALLASTRVNDKGDHVKPVEMAFNNADPRGRAVELDGRISRMMTDPEASANVRTVLSQLDDNGKPNWPGYAAQKERMLTTPQTATG